MKSHHVLHDGDSGWNVHKDSSKRISGHYDNKQDAIAAARIISRNQKSELFIHGKDGKIQSRDSHGNDPYPPKG